VTDFASRRFSSYCSAPPWATLKIAEEEGRVIYNGLSPDPGGCGVGCGVALLLDGSLLLPKLNMNAARAAVEGVGLKQF